MDGRSGRGPGHPGVPRVDRPSLHNLTDILVVSVLAVIRGTDSFVAIALCGRLNEAWLRTACSRTCASAGILKMW